jgi:hypothetical protein
MGARSPRATVAFLAVVAAVLVVVGCLSTWAKVQGVSFSGTDANAGKSTLAAAAIAGVLILLATGLGWRWLSIVAAIPAAIGAAIVSYRLADIANFVQGTSDATAGWGVWLATIASIALFLLCLLHAFLPRAPAATPAPPPAEPPPAEP